MCLLPIVRRSYRVLTVGCDQIHMLFVVARLKLLKLFPNTARWFQMVDLDGEKLQGSWWSCMWWSGVKCGVVRSRRLDPAASGQCCNTTKRTGWIRCSQHAMAKTNYPSRSRLSLKLQLTAASGNCQVALTSTGLASFLVLKH